MTEPTTPDARLIQAIHDADVGSRKAPGTTWCLPGSAYKNMLPGGFIYERYTAFITALSEAGWEIVRAAPEPDAPEITGAMIRSGLMAHIRSLRNTPEGQAIVRGVRPPKDEDDEPGGMHYEAMRAALDAALKARG